MKKITVIEPLKIDASKPKLRVAAYCRVSTASDAQHESLEAQKSHYERYIALRTDWEFAGIYYDSGITGTRADCREALQNLLADCKCGKINLVLTKSISRLARNTTDCLEIVRELISLNIPIIFEKENINTGSMESEMLLGIMSSLAESESVSSSQNIKWSIRNRFMDGTFDMHSAPYGYCWNTDKLEIIPEEAEIVRLIFSEAISGAGAHTIAKKLNLMEIPTRKQKTWSSSVILSILKNERYTGNALFQKTYTDDQFRRHANHGECGQYFAAGCHQAIISQEIFDTAAKIIQQRADEKNITGGDKKYQKRYAFQERFFAVNAAVLSSGESTAVMRNMQHGHVPHIYGINVCVPCFFSGMMISGLLSSP